MKHTFKLAALAAVLFASATAQAHQFQDKAAGYEARLSAVAVNIHRLGCHAATVDAPQIMSACLPANAAELGVDILETLPKDASDAEARRAFAVAGEAIQLALYEEFFPVMYSEFKSGSREEHALDTYLTEIQHLTGELMIASVDPKELKK